jgi:neutral trehalase
MESIRFKTEEVEVKTCTNSISHLERLINRQRVSNIELRGNADNLFEIVKSLAGDTPREIYNYDKEELQKLPHISSLEENNFYYERILEDIKISIHYLEDLIK